MLSRCLCFSPLSIWGPGVLRHKRAHHVTSFQHARSPQKFLANGCTGSWKVLSLSGGFTECTCLLPFGIDSYSRPLQRQSGTGACGGFLFSIPHFISDIPVLFISTSSLSPASTFPSLSPLFFHWVFDSSPGVLVRLSLTYCLFSFDVFLPTFQGSYNQDLPPSGPSFTIQARRSADDWRDRSPGPGQYRVQDNQVSRSAPAFTMGSREAFDRVPRSEVPGPVCVWFSCFILSLNSILTSSGGFLFCGLPGAVSWNPPPPCSYSLSFPCRAFHSLDAGFLFCGCSKFLACIHYAGSPLVRSSAGLSRSWKVLPSRPVSPSISVLLDGFRCRSKCYCG